MTSMAFCRATIFWIRVGSVAASVSGSLSSTAAEDRPNTRATVSRACATFDAAFEASMASTIVVRGVTVTDGLLAASSTIALIV